MRKSESLDITRPLPPKVEEAARLEVMEGLTITDIAERLDIRRETISLYRNHHPQYLVVRAEAAKEILEPLTSGIDLSRSESIDVFRESLKRVKVLLHYEVDGLPVPSVQLEAARIGVLVGTKVLGGLDETSAKAQATAAAAVVLKFDGTPDQLKVMTDKIEIVDGEIVSSE